MQVIGSEQEQDRKNQLQRRSPSLSALRFASSVAAVYSADMRRSKGADLLLPTLFRAALSTWRTTPTCRLVTASLPDMSALQLEIDRTRVHVLLMKDCLCIPSWDVGSNLLLM